MRHLLPASLSIVLLVAGCGEKKSPRFECPAPVGTSYDSDGDLLRDAWEAWLGTDPERADSDGDGAGDFAEVSAGTDPLSGSSSPAATQVASVTTITDLSQLIGGPAAQGRVGDWLLRNDKIRVIVQRAGAEQMQVNSYGGNVIDADVVRADGEPGNDIVGSVQPIITTFATSAPTRAIVIADGSDGGPAILRTCGSVDLFEYLDLGAIARANGFGLAVDTNQDLPFKISNDYILAPGASTLEIVTTIGNEGAGTKVTLGDVLDSGGATGIFATNEMGFGETSLADIISNQPPIKFLAFEGPGGTWGLLNDADVNAGLTVVGVSALVQGFDSPLQAIGVNPETDDPSAGLLAIGKGKRLSYHRSLVVSGSTGVESVAAEFHRRHSAGSTLHAGIVRDESNVPLAGARVAVLSSAYVPLTLAVSATDGSYSAYLPSGSYHVLADIPGRGAPTFVGGTTVSVATLHNGNSLTASQVSLTAGSALPEIRFPATARLQVTVTEAGTASAIPARLAVVGPDSTPDDSIFRNRKDSLPGTFAAAAVSKDGTFALDLEPGTYALTASHGFEWSIAQANVTLTAGATQSQALSIGEVVDTSGWVSADFHVHMLNSPDSPIPLASRVIGAAADGLDVLVTTDHDFVTDLQPLVVAEGLGSWMSSLPGDEISTTAYGHFIAFPLDADATKVDGGAFKWTGAGGGRNSVTPKDFFEAIELANSGPQVNVVAHPRGGNITSYYTATGLDTDSLVTEADPVGLGLPVQPGATATDSKLFYSDLDAQEILNGSSGLRRGDAAASIEYRSRLLNDLFSLLSNGVTPVGLGNSDTHTLLGDMVASPRNYVKVADDTPSVIPAARDAFAQSVIDGRLVVSAGVFMTVTATGATTGEPGGLVQPDAGGNVALSIGLQMPEWVAVDTVKVFVNTPNTVTPADADGNSGEPLAQFTIDTFTLGSALLPNGLVRRTATVNQVVPVAQGNDSWIVVTAEGAKPGAKSLWPVVPVGSSDTNGLRAFGLANAIFVDGNANGTYEGPGNTTTTSYRRPPPADTRTPRRDDLKAPLAPDVRAQFEKIDEHGH